MKVFYSRLVGEITYDSTRKVLEDLDKANSDDKINEIRMTITSQGGLFYPSFAIYDHIKHSKKPVDIIAEGTCQSCAVMILQAARRRFATEHTIFMVHPGQFKFEERRSYDEAMNTVDQFKKNHDIFVELSISRSGMTRKEFEKIFNPIKYLTPHEALKFGKNGLIDEIIK